MKRYNLYLSESQLEKFAKLSEARDISVSELIRRALDEYIVKEVKEEVVEYQARKPKKRSRNAEN